jgi:pseudouridine-5'-phosphate glycosidase
MNTMDTAAARTPHPALALTGEVREALAAGHPVVALESTIISHGMPYPQNVAMATEVERIIRDGGAVPATIAVLEGRPRVGLSAADLELLATDPHVEKVSLRDLPYVIARGGHGATTVAATMRLAALAGIRTFVTGGLGGVHRGAQQSFDVSADLTELAQTDVAVVSAGVKSILDIGLTLETLETLGVPVIGYGTDEFPAFFSRRSGHAAPMRADSPAEIAAVMGRSGTSASAAAWTSPTRSRRPRRSRRSRSTRSSTGRWPTWTRRGSRASRPRRSCSAGSSRSPAARACAPTSPW